MTKPRMNNKQQLHKKLEYLTLEFCLSASGLNKKNKKLAKLPNCKDW